MPKLKVDNFLDLVRRSGLIDKVQLEKMLTELAESDGGEPTGGESNGNGGHVADSGRVADSGHLADKLIEAGKLTRWQCDKLMEGRHKGFFLGKYKLLRHLGTGGMSSVYLAENTLMKRLVALKVLPQNKVADSSYLPRFYREAQAAASLDHPNIVRAYDIDNDGKTHYIVMEFVEGRDLQVTIKQDGPLAYDTAVKYIYQAAEGLSHAHAAGLVHRDIKPGNLLVDLKGTVKVLDLGLALFNDESQASLTMAHDENVLGTADYLAPEQALNSHSVDHRADIYSLGCTLYFMLTGHPPFPDGTLAQRLMKHHTDEPSPIAKERPDVPRNLVEIVAKMMAKKAPLRYQTATEVALAMNAWLERRGMAIYRPGGDSHGANAQSGSHPGVRPGQRGKAESDAALPRAKLLSPADTVSNKNKNTLSGAQRAISTADLARTPAGGAPRVGQPLSDPNKPKDGSRGSLRVAKSLDPNKTASNDFAGININKTDANKSDASASRRLGDSSKVRRAENRPPPPMSDSELQVRTQRSNLLFIAMMAAGALAVVAFLALVATM